MSGADWAVVLGASALILVGLPLWYVYGPDSCGSQHTTDPPPPEPFYGRGTISVSLQPRPEPVAGRRASDRERLPPCVSGQANGTGGGTARGVKSGELRWRRNPDKLPAKPCRVCER